MTISREILESIRRVAPLSQSALRLLQITAAPQYSMRDVLGVVQNDAVLTGNILRIVNSAAYARRGAIETVARAVPLVGERALVGMAVGLCAGPALNTELKGYDAERGLLWRHSLRTAVAAREMAAFCAGVDPEVAYTAGIMHDIGKTVISAYLQGRVHEAVHAAESTEIGDYLFAEHQLLGTDHCEVGAALAEHWRLPHSLAAVIRWHHDPARAPAEQRPLCYLIHLGDFAAMMAGAGTGADTLLYPLVPTYRDYVRIGRKELDRVMARIEIEFEREARLTFPMEEDSK